MSFNSSPSKNYTEALTWMSVWASLYYSANAPGLGSIWILNIQWSRQSLKCTGWMGLPWDHKGSTVHYLLKLPINCSSHSLSLSVSPSLTLPLSEMVSVCRSLSDCLHLFLSPSLCLPAFICEYHTLILGCFSSVLSVSLNCLGLFLPSSLPLSLFCVPLLLMIYLSGCFTVCVSLCCVH